MGGRMASHLAFVASADPCRCLDEQYEPFFPSGQSGERRTSCNPRSNVRVAGCEPARSLRQVQVEGSMKQLRVLVGALGLMLAAGFAAADPPGTPPTDVTLFGQKYALSQQSLTGK